MSRYVTTFRHDSDKWRKLVAKARELGVDKAYTLLDSFTDKMDGVKVAEKSKVERKDHTELTSVSKDVKTLDDLLELFEVDLDRYEVVSYTVNNWQQGARIKEQIVVTDLYQVKASIRLKANNIADIIAKVVDRVADGIPKAKTIKPKKRKNVKRDLLIEPFITDLHIGKIGKDWSVKGAVDMYEQIISELVNEVDLNRVDRFLLPVGNDLINIDNQGNTTFAGTPQMAGEYYEDMIVQTELMLERVIRTLGKLAPVDVVCVPGNHDQQSVFHIGRTIWGAFRDEDRVSVINNSNARYYYTWKKVLIGLSHGNNEKINELPKIMAAEVPNLWGGSICREFHIGHYHRTNVKQSLFNIDSEVMLKGVTVRICPTVCPSDRWHKKKGYIGGVRRSQSFVFSPEHLERIMYFNL